MNTTDELGIFDWVSDYSKKQQPIKQTFLTTIQVLKEIERNTKVLLCFLLSLYPQKTL